MIGLKVTAEQKEKLQELANKENRPLANFCMNIIIEAVREKFEIDLTLENKK